ncbi:hypothetical protein [Streptomyces sp. NPDC059378]|uniref:hypothetical protein n=1 Tax=Streptomyces sp. NPDC059378 TaxID=3346815 RepID=UPI0036ADB216
MTEQQPQAPEATDEQAAGASAEVTPEATDEQAAGTSAEVTPEPTDEQAAGAPAEVTPEATAEQVPVQQDVTEASSAEESPAAVPVADLPAVPKNRRVLRAVLRWTAVITVFAAFGAGTAYGITSMERTDVPGLATASDGRWAYPEITRPPLPSGSPRPTDPKNWARAHYADLRALLLPAPEGATEDKALRGTDGWLPTKDFLAMYEARKDRDEAGQLLADNGLRHMAARGWTAQDGTRTAVYLLQFDTGTVADDVYGKFTQYDAPEFVARGTTEAQFDETYPIEADVTGGVTRNTYDEIEPYGAEQVRQAYLSAGDVIAVIVQSHKGTAAAVPFQQTVALQSELLG